MDVSRIKTLSAVASEPAQVYPPPRKPGASVRHTLSPSVPPPLHATMMMSMVSTTSVNFVATKESAPFETKYIMLRSNAVVLGRQQTSNSAAPTNGIFALGSQQVSDDLPVNVSHAELYVQNGQVYIKDLGSRYGTWVDGVRIQGPTLLRDGSIVELGAPMQRTASTPATVEDEFLRPVSGTVTIVK